MMRKNRIPQTNTAPLKSSSLGVWGMIRSAATDWIAMEAYRRPEMNSLERLRMN